MSRIPDAESLTPHQQREKKIEIEREQARASRYRLRLKAAPEEDQEVATKRAREARAKYREKNRVFLKDRARCARIVEYGNKYGLHTFEEKVKQKIERQCLARERRRRISRVRAKGASHASGREGESDREAILVQSFLLLTIMQTVMNKPVWAGGQCRPFMATDASFRLPARNRTGDGAIKIAIEGRCYVVYFKHFTLVLFREVERDSELDVLEID
ncbi:hypothetical protein B0H13DRAFT_2389684 [Mycena leptocephala]|nr:hypothetical protein B0H13DRAFT_2389684 [Mycena leptocephala]